MNEHKPLLAVVYSARSRPWREIAEAAADVCRLLWIVDAARLGPTVNVLGRIGKVIDTAGCTPEELIQLVHAEHPQGITSYFDADLHLQAWLGAALGLAGPSIEAAARLNDKLLQREALAQAGVPVPQFCALVDHPDADDLDRLCETLSFPMLLKPRDGHSGRGIFPVSNRAELIEALRGLERPSRMIVEEQMADLPAKDAPYADRVSVDSVVRGGKHSHLGILGLFPMAPPFRSSGGFFPAEVPRSDIPELFGLASASIRAMGADTGCYRTEVKLTPDGHKVIEINGRPTGLTPAVVQLASGVPLLELSMRLALGERVCVKGPVTCDRIAYRYYREPPMSARKVCGITGLQRLQERAGVMQIDVHKRVGDPVDWRNGSLDKVFQVTGTVSDYAELAEHYRACSADSFVTYEYES
jgi:biotin carboxylase